MTDSRWIPREGVENGELQALAMSGTQIEIRGTIFKPGIQKRSPVYLQVSKKEAMSNQPMSVLVTVSYCYLVYLNVEIKRIEGRKSWLKKGVSELQV